MFNFRNDRSRSGPQSGTETQRRERGPAQRMRDLSRGRGSEDWGQEWGEDWRGEDESGDRGGRAMHWREGMERDRAQRAGQPSYGGGYFGDAGSGGQSYSGGQRVYPDNPGYRHHAPYAAQAEAPGGQRAGRRPVGPKGYRRTDERVREEVCERLAMNPYVDVGDVSVEVANGVVTLDGTVRERREKYVIEDIADAVFGVTDVDNRLRVQRQPGAAWAAGSEAGGDDAAGTDAPATSPERTLNKS